MFFRKKEEIKADSGTNPPWVNIDQVPQVKHEGRMRFNLTDFVIYATGFSRRGTKLLLFGFAIGLAFAAYALYATTKAGPPLPPAEDRPAMDKYASSTIHL